MTDNELWASLYKKYGRDFDPKALPEDDPLVMEFWDRVHYLLLKHDINKKTLAYEAEFDQSNITKGRKSGAYPAANTAVKIAKVLNVSVEFLVTGNDSYFHLLKKKVEQFEKEFSELSERDKEIIINLIHVMKNKSDLIQ